MFRVATCLVQQHDWRLVVLAGVVCFLTSLAAISLFCRARATDGRKRAIWLISAGLTAGCGIWATHFIAALAYQPGVVLQFHVGLTILSLVVSIGITGSGFAVAMLGRRSSVPLGGALVGAGVACMHYVGMRSLEAPGDLSFAPDLVAASVAFAVLFGAAALWIATERRGLRAVLAAAGMLTLAIVALHFTAMGAVTLVPDPALTVNASTLPPAILALLIAVAISAVLGVAFVAALLDQRLDDHYRLLDGALQNVTQGVVMFDGAGRLLLANDRYRQIYRLSEAQTMPGTTLRQILEHRIAAGTFDGDPAAEYHDGREETKIEQKLPDGRTILFGVRRRADGGWVATHEDITELKRREASFRLMFECNPIPMWVVDRATFRFLDVNDAAVEHYGYPREQFLGLTAFDIRAPEEREELRKSLASGEIEARGRIHRHRTADGRKIQVALYTRPLNVAGQDAVLVASIDITARKLVEDELRRMRVFLNAVIESVPATIIVREASDDRRYVLINRACEKFLGITRDKVIGRTVREVLPPPAAEFIEARDRELLQQGHEIFDAENLLSTPDQGARYMTARRLVIRDERDQPQYLLTVIDDVTEQRLAHDKLAEASELMRTVIDASPVAIMGSVPSGEVIIWNRAAEDLFGYTTEEALGRCTVDLMAPDDRREEFLQARVKAFAGTTTRNLIAQRKRKDGTIIDVQLAAAPVFNPDGTVRALIVAMEDITSRRSLEEQLRQAQKMEAIGQLTGGLAHDFNNLLAIIIGNLDLLREQVGWNPDALEAVDEALGASLRGADLNRRLLAFARRQPLQPKSVELNELVSAMSKLLERTLGEHISIKLALGAELWPLLVDPTQLESALTNLAVNARDAMPTGGQLTIGTRNIAFDQGYAELHGDVAPGDYVVLEVSDTGTGMPPEVIARVFEPFFTTKAKDKGTGLGLSMVFGFVKQSGGHVQVYSEVGVGTTVRLYLPRAASAAAADEARPDAAMPRGYETVLAVEDNAGLRRILVRQLNDLGYKVLEAEDARSAVEVLKGRESIDLLFTDIVLPNGVNGAELARMAAALRSNLKVLFTSGFPEAAFGQNGALPQGASLLGKPYRKEELAQRLREALAA
ncbi:MAG TPA: PAS domain S-box protein [Xanthobacteraceae bacterium]|nr:PAS domain S-box protein [Xanthobacteraceae bacterium]